MTDADAWLADYIRHEATIVESSYPNDARNFAPGRFARGYAGEMEFGRLLGLMPNFIVDYKGDGGVDFRITLEFTVDVKTACSAPFLICPQGEVTADIYVLAEGDNADPTARPKLLGWQWGEKLRAAPLRSFGHPVLNHHIPREQLRPLADLVARYRGPGRPG